jgi:hypothetical protein
VSVYGPTATALTRESPPLDNNGVECGVIMDVFVASIINVTSPLTSFGEIQILKTDIKKLDRLTF